MENLNSKRTNHSRVVVWLRKGFRSTLVIIFVVMDQVINDDISINQEEDEIEKVQVTQEKC
jgi:hypothetical protein